MATNNTKRLAGIANFTIDAANYQLVGDLMYSCSSVEREGLFGMDGYHGYSEKFVTGFMSMKVRDNATVSVKSFEDMTQVTVIAETSNGKSVTGQSMVCMKAIEVNTMEGTFELRFEGPNVSESV